MLISIVACALLGAVVLNLYLTWRDVKIMDARIAEYYKKR